MSNYYRAMNEDFGADTEVNLNQSKTHTNWTIYRPLEGFLDGKAYVTDDEGNIAFFNSRSEAHEHLQDTIYLGCSGKLLSSDLLNRKVVIEEYDGNVINAS